MQNNPLNSLDVLKHIETVVERTNILMEKKSKSAFVRYPITFTILVLFGVIALSEGIKGVLEDIGIIDYSGVLIGLGLLILIITGTVYKKLDK